MNLSFPAMCALDAGYHRAYRDVYLDSARDTRDASKRRMFVELARNRQRLFLANIRTSRRYEVSR